MSSKLRKFVPSEEDGIPVMVEWENGDYLLESDVVEALDKLEATIKALQAELKQYKRKESK